ncbi:MAG: energy transducer TonB [Gammaproteobacteria bacterium]|nr:MAG: energy transducer TonB [Gammaproteobacteria bacterium]
MDIPLNLTGGPYIGDFRKSEKRAPPPPPPPRKPAIEAPETAVPTYRVPPVYPPRALRAGIEGSVTVEFTITPEGEVADPEIVKADPPKIFDRAVLRAIRKWKFQPKIVDGKPVARRAVQVIRFTLDRNRRRR